jgi:hypothetical protein
MSLGKVGGRIHASASLCTHPRYCGQPLPVEPELSGVNYKKITHWSTFDRSGHFAAHSVPNLLIRDIREFFRRFRWHSAKKPSHEEKIRTNQLGEHYGWRFLSC